MAPSFNILNLIFSFIYTPYKSYATVIRSVRNIGLNNFRERERASEWEGGRRSEWEWVWVGESERESEWVRVSVC
jgi:hypothetical protein